MQSNFMQSQASGYLIAIVQAICYAGMGVISKYLYNTGLNPEQVTGIRYFGAVIIVAIMILATKRRPILSRRPVVYVQASLFVLSAYLYLVAVDMLTAGLATVIFYSFPAVVTILSVFALHEPLTLRAVIALVLAMSGIVLISGVISPDAIQLSPMGIFLAIVACVAFAIYTVIGQKTVKSDGQLTLTFTMCAAGAVAVLVLFPSDMPALLHMTPEQWAWSFAVSFFCTVLPVLLLLAAIKRIGATKSALISTSETPFSLLFAFLLLGETLTWMQAVGTVLVVASIVVTTVPSHKAKKGEAAESDPSQGDSR